MSSSIDTRVARVIRAEVAPQKVASTLELSELHTGRGIGHAAAMRGYDDGYEAGFAEGRNAGYAEGREQAMQELAVLQQHANAVLEAMSSAVADLAAIDRLRLNDLEGEIASTAMQLAEAIIGRELEVSRSPGADALARALALVPGDESVIAHLHPDDIALLDLDTVARGRQLAVVPDLSVDHGGCVLDTGNRRIDATLRNAIERARGALAGDR